MKKHILSYAFAAFAALSCSSMASLQTQVYDDGLYTRPAVAAAPAEAVPVSGEEVDNLLAMSKQSPAYILSEGDTLVVPAGSEVRFRNNSTVLEIVDAEKPEDRIAFTFAYSPDGAKLGACHKIQNEGAVQTYVKRYLYQNAYEIAEADALDSTIGKPEKRTPARNQKEGSDEIK